MRIPSLAPGRDVRPRPAGAAAGSPTWGLSSGARVANAFRRRPELLFLPTAGVMVAFSIAPFAFGIGWGVKFLVWLSSPDQPVIYPVTWTASWLSFLLTATVAWRRRGLHPLRAVFVGAALPFGATGTFEIVYQFIGAGVQPGGFGMSTISWIGIVLWTLPSVTAVPYWRVTRTFWAVLLAEAVGFAAWAAVGYPQVTWGNIAQEPAAYAFNIALKLGAFALFALPTLAGLRTQPASEQPGGASPASLDSVGSPSPVCGGLP